jgi:hypothetical protein
MRRQSTFPRTSFVSAGSWAIASSLATLLLVVCCSTVSQAETLKKRYTFDYDRTTRRASSLAAASKARKKLLLDFLAAKFSPEIISNFAEDIDVALDPPDEYLASFKIVSEKVSDDETKVALTVEGEFEFPEMVNALVQNKVLSFGKQPPKVMVLPSSRFEDPRAAKSLRALIYDKIKQAGLRPVAFESTSESLSFRIKDKITPTSLERQAMIRSAIQYGADYLIYIDAEVEARPFTQGGYIADINFIHTILRPNGSLILGESIVSERGSGSTATLAFDRALDSVAPVIAKLAIGQLYESIYSDSDVITDTPQLKQEKTLVINFANSGLVQALIERLQKTGATTRLLTGMTDVTSRVSVETMMDDFQLYQWCNDQDFTIGGKGFKTPVVAYAENRIEVEAVADREKPKRAPLASPPRNIKRPGNTRPVSPADSLAKIVLKMRPPRFN